MSESFLFGGERPGQGDSLYSGVPYSLLVILLLPYLDCKSLALEGGPEDSPASEACSLARA